MLPVPSRETGSRLVTFALALTFCLSVINAHAQIIIDSVLVYHAFNEKGFTTAGAYANFNDLAQRSVRKTKFDVEDDLRFLATLDAVPAKKHQQRKFPPGMIFLLAYDEGREYKLALAAGTGIWLVTDLTRMKEYRITEEEDVRWIKKLLAKMKG
jgi:hypothetical protein